ncbi:hypothetical protein Droror1_Dr00006202 [Drosera rotundifolia]
MQCKPLSEPEWGYVVVTTPNGVLDHEEASRQNLGGQSHIGSPSHVSAVIPLLSLARPAAAITVSEPPFAAVAILRPSKPHSKLSLAQVASRSAPLRANFAQLAGGLISIGFQLGFDGGSSDRGWSVANRLDNELIGPFSSVFAELGPNSARTAEPTSNPTVQSLG